MNEALKKYKDLLIQKRYNDNTLKTYCNYFKDFCIYFKDEKLGKITISQINTYILKLIQSRNISISQQNQRINAIKFYYEKVLGREKQYYELHRPNKEHKLPKVLSKNEVKNILNSCNNIKHKCILMLIYSAGLRRSELLNLAISDIDSERMVININSAKGMKDRISLLSDNLLQLLRQYYIKYTNQRNIFLKDKMEANILQQA